MSADSLEQQQWDWAREQHRREQLAWSAAGKVGLIVMAVFFVVGVLLWVVHLLSRCPEAVPTPESTPITEEAITP